MHCQNVLPHLRYAAINRRYALPEALLGLTVGAKNLAPAEIKHLIYRVYSSRTKLACLGIARFVWTVGAGGNVIMRTIPRNDDWWDTTFGDQCIEANFPPQSFPMVEDRQEDEYIWI